jgi:uncharacterized protein (TIGR02246 family)
MNSSTNHSQIDVPSSQLVRMQMNRSNKAAWLAVGIVSFLGLMTGLAHAASPTSADEAALRAQPTNWGKAYNAGDAKAVAALYADDGQMLPPGAPGVRGRAAIQEFLAKELAGSKDAGVVISFNPVTDVGVSGDMGWQSATYKVTIKGDVVETGKSLSVSRKKDGKWYYVRDIWNADTPPVPAAPPAPPAPAPKK